MKRILPWIVGGLLALAVLDAAAQEAGRQDAAPWRLETIAKSSHAPDDESPKAVQESQPTFLRLRVQLRPGLAEPKLHQFRVTDAAGTTVAEAYGYYEKDSLLVFEGNWADLRGLYLDGLGHREPLFAEEPAPKPPPEPGTQAPPKAKGVPPGPSKPAVGHGKKAAAVKSIAKPKGSGSGSGKGGGPGSGEPPEEGSGGRSRVTTVTTSVLPVVPRPPMVLYLSCGEEGGTGRVYQVDETGMILGVVHLPYTATGLALHRTRGLAAVMPRDGGRLVRIDDRGRVSTVLWKDPLLIHPVEVAIPAESDTIMVADDIRHVLASTDVTGAKPQVFRRFNLAASERPSMSVAVTPDGHVLYGSSKDPGVYRFRPGDAAASVPPLLPKAGGVAADVASLRWAATQGPNEIVVFTGEEVTKTVRLPPDAALYAGGLVAFGPRSSVVAAAQHRGAPAGEVWFYVYENTADGFRSLFSWRVERLVDFVVGPPMLWPKDIPLIGGPRY